VARNAFRSRQPVQVATPAPPSLPVFQVVKDVVVPATRSSSFGLAYTRKAMERENPGSSGRQRSCAPRWALTDVRVVRSLDAKYGSRPGGAQGRPSVAIRSWHEGWRFPSRCRSALN
jgi:hypothetical protein